MPSKKIGLGLRALLEPISAESFFNDYYEKKPLHLSDRKPSQVYPCLPEVEKFEELLWRNEEKLRRVLRVNKGGRYVPLPHPSQGKSLFRWSVDQFSSGSTLILNGVDTMSNSIARITRAIEVEFGGKVAANAFFTPSEQQGFLPHFDTHDVFVLQLAGRKTWPLYDRRIDLPIDRQIYLVDQSTVEEPTGVFDLEPGDLLYVPRGTIHGPHTTNSYSLHITMGFRPLRWVDYFSSLIQIVAEGNPLFRRSVLETSDDEFHRQATELSKILSDLTSAPRNRKLAIERLNQTFNAQLRPLPGGHFMNSICTANIDEDTVLIRRRESACHIYENQDSVRIQFPGIGLATDEDLQPGCIEAPLMAGGIFRWIAKSTSPFTVKDLPKGLSPESQLEILRELTRNGLLKVLESQTH